MKLVSEKKEFEKDGKKIGYTQVYLILDTGYRIAIKNVFKGDRNVLLSVVGKELE